MYGSTIPSVAVNDSSSSMQYTGANHEGWHLWSQHIWKSWTRSWTPWIANIISYGITAPSTCIRGQQEQPWPKPHTSVNYWMLRYRVPVSAIHLVPLLWPIRVMVHRRLYSATTWLCPVIIQLSMLLCGKGGNRNHPLFRSRGVFCAF